MTGEVTVVDHGTGMVLDPKAWAEEHFEAITRAEVSAWDIVLDLAREWTDGLCVSRFYPDPRPGYEGQTMTIAMALKAHWEGRAQGAPPPDRSYVERLSNAAQVYLMAGDEWRDVSPRALRPFGSPDRWTPETVQAALRTTREMRGEVTYRTVQAQVHPSKGRPDYWSEVATNLMTGGRDLTVDVARNCISSAEYWLAQQAKGKR